MALKKLPGGVVVETDGGARLNEEAGVNLEAIHRQLVAGAAAGAKAEADAARAVYSATPLGPTDLNTLTTPQRRAATLSTEVDAPNSPWPGRRALYVVEATPDGSTVVQRAFELQGARRAERVFFGGAWSAWAAPGAGVTVVENTAQDLNALTAPGDYVLVRSTVVAGMKNAPATERLRVTVGGSVVGPYLVQSATGLVSGGVWSRTLDAGTWTPWQRLDGTPTAPAASSTSSGVSSSPNLISRFHLEHRLQEDQNHTSKGKKPSQSMWSPSAKDRQESLQERKAQMILQARKRMEERQSTRT